MWILPKLFYQARKTINDLGLGYNQFDACTNDCMLYIQEREKVSTLHIQYLALLEEKATPEATNQSFNNTRKILSKFCGIFFWYQGFKDITWKKTKRSFIYVVAWKWSRQRCYVEVSHWFWSLEKFWWTLSRVSFRSSQCRIRASKWWI